MIVVNKFTVLPKQNKTKKKKQVWGQEHEFNDFVTVIENKTNLKGETWEEEWFSQGQLKLDLRSPIHCEKTPAIFIWYTYTKNLKEDQKRNCICWLMYM